MNAQDYDSGWLIFPRILYVCNFYFILCRASPSFLSVNWCSDL